MSNVHFHWHRHAPGRFQSYGGEQHGGGWHAHRHIHTRRVSDEVETGDPHVATSHGHDHISSEMWLHDQPEG